MVQSGLERVMTTYLRGRDGYRKVVVDSRGRIHDESNSAAAPGQDLISTIDLDLQLAAEEGSFVLQQLSAALSWRWIQQR